MSNSRKLLISIRLVIVLMLMTALTWAVWRIGTRPRGRRLAMGMISGKDKAARHTGSSQRCRESERVMLEQEQWEPYTITKWEQTDEDGFLEEVIEVTRDSQVILRAGGPKADFWVDDVTGDGDSELFVQEYSGGNYGTWDLFIYTGRPDIRKLGGWAIGNYPIEIQDLNGDGKSELIGWEVDSLSGYGNNLCRSPPLPVVFAYKEGNLVEVTRRYPQIVEQELKGLQSSLEHPWKDDPQASWLLPQLLGCAAILGRGKQECDWVRAHLDAAAIQWVSDHQAEIERRVHNRKSPIQKYPEDE